MRNYQRWQIDIKDEGYGTMLRNHGVWMLFLTIIGVLHAFIAGRWADKNFALQMIVITCVLMMIGASM